MMKRSLSIPVILSALLISLLLTDTGWSQERSGDSPRVSPNAAVSQTIGTTVVDVAYGRPAVNDRVIFGGLVPFGERWRTGADETTTITFSDDVVFGGEPLSAGSYSLHTIPGEDEWIIIINENHTWGTQYSESADVIRVTAQSGSGPYVDRLMIYFENVTAGSGDLVIHWDETRVPVTISIP